VISTRNIFSDSLRECAAANFGATIAVASSAANTIDHLITNLGLG
jgi:hypothetical protein